MLPTRQASPRQQTPEKKEDIKEKENSEKQENRTETESMKKIRKAIVKANEVYDEKVNKRLDQFFNMIHLLLNVA